MSAALLTAAVLVVASTVPGPAPAQTVHRGTTPLPGPIIRGAQPVV